MCGHERDGIGEGPKMEQGGADPYKYPGKDEACRITLGNLWILQKRLSEYLVISRHSALRIT